MASNWDRLDQNLRESVQENVELYERVRPAVKATDRRNTGLPARSAWIVEDGLDNTLRDSVSRLRDSVLRLRRVHGWHLLESPPRARYPYRLALYTYACALAGIAGAAYANLTEFVAPNTMSWVVSGELLFMVILGTAGTLFGAIIGAVVFVGLEQILSSYTEYWLFPLGVILVLRVLVLKR
jgi:hypothetical protein